MSDDSLEEPRRLAETGTTPSAQMLRAARRVHASPEVKRRLLRRLGWLTLVSAISSYANEVAAAIGSSKTLAVMSGVGVVIAVGVGVHTLQAPAPPTPPLLPAIEVPHRPVVLNEPPAEVVAPQRVVPGPERASSGSHPRQPSNPGLSEEIRLVDAARGALRNGNPGAALKRLDQYGTRFPRGRFSLEVAALRIEALSAMGERARARMLAQQFIERHPKSLLVERVRAYAANPTDR